MMMPFSNTLPAHTTVTRWDAYIGTPSAGRPPSSEPGRDRAGRPHVPHPGHPVTGLPRHRPATMDHAREAKVNRRFPHQADDRKAHEETPSGRSAVSTTRLGRLRDGWDPSAALGV